MLQNIHGCKIINMEVNPMKREREGEKTNIYNASKS